MPLCCVLLRRPTADVTYGFTIRHCTVYPPKQDSDNNNVDYCHLRMPTFSSSNYTNSNAIITAIISRVQPHSIADNAGLHSGDRVVSLNDESLNELGYKQICELIQQSGLQLRVMVLRSPRPSKCMSETPCSDDRFARDYFSDYSHSYARQPYCLSERFRPTTQSAVGCNSDTTLENDGAVLSSADRRIPSTAKLKQNRCRTTVYGRPPLPTNSWKPERPSIFAYNEYYSDQRVDTLFDEVRLRRRQQYAPKAQLRPATMMEIEPTIATTIATTTTTVITTITPTTMTTTTTLPSTRATPPYHTDCRSFDTITGVTCSSCGTHITGTTSHTCDSCASDVVRCRTVEFPSRFRQYGVARNRVPTTTTTYARPLSVISTPTCNRPTPLINSISNRSSYTEPPVTPPTMYRRRLFTDHYRISPFSTPNASSCCSTLEMSDSKNGSTSVQRSQQSTKCSNFEGDYATSFAHSSPSPVSVDYPVSVEESSTTFRSRPPSARPPRRFPTTVLNVSNTANTAPKQLTTRPSNLNPALNKMDVYNHQPSVPPHNERSSQSIIVGSASDQTNRRAVNRSSGKSSFNDNSFSGRKYIGNPMKVLSNPTFNRFVPRQASFMAAIANSENTDVNGIMDNDHSRLLTVNCCTTNTTTGSSLDKFHHGDQRQRCRDHSRDQRENHKDDDQLHNDRFDFSSVHIPPLGSSTTSLITPVQPREHNEKRQRPKSYMMATSSSSPMSISDDSMVEDTKRTTSPLRRLLSSQPSLSTTIVSSTDVHPQTLRKNASSVLYPPTTHRIQRFITFFSSSDHHNKSSTSTLHASKSNIGRHLKRSTTTIVSSPQPQPPSSGAPAFVPIKAKDVSEQGQLFHQETALGESLKPERCRWEQCWAVLHAYNLYLCRQLSSYVSDESHERVLNIPADSRTIDVRSAIVDIAYELLHQKDDHRTNVFRVVTQKRTEHLLQAESEERMLNWINQIQNASAMHSVRMCDQPNSAHSRVAKTKSVDFLCIEKDSLSNGSVPHLRQRFSHQNPPNNRHSRAEFSASTITSDTTVPHANSVCDPQATSSSAQDCCAATTQLIMHRYKAKTTQLCSPCTSKRFNTPEASALVHNVLPGPSSSVTSSTVTTKSEDSSTTVSNTTSDAGQTTPKSARKWRKSKGTKHSSSNSSSKYDRSSIASTSALGQKISDCPTSGEGDLVPLLVQRCVQCVEAHGMETVGIYRIPGNTAAVNALKESLSHGIENVDCSDARWKDVNVVSSLLKMFLRKLPEPLLTDKLYPIFIDANRISNHRQRLHKLRNLLRKLPPAHYATLKYLIRHLREVVQHSDVNKMETRNMALMFGPSIVRPSDDNMATMVTHMSDQCKIIETFITYYDWVFNDAGTTDDDVPPAVPSACDASASNCGQNSNTLSSGIESDLSVSQGGMMTASFNDMHNLIRKVNEAEATAMMDAQKGGKIKQILNVRRNSRRDRSKKRERERERDHSANPLTSSTCSSAVINQHESAVPTPTSITSTVEHAFCGRYQERDIDAEIASRCQKTVTSASGITNSSMDNSPSVDSSLGSMVDSNYQNSSRTNGAVVEGAAHDADEGEEQKYDVDAMRRRRQQTISSARRMFIVGSNVDPNNEAECHHADLDDLVSHTRHLNVAASPALDVLSAETREKIRRIQQLQGWQTTATERHATSAATNVNTDTSTLTKAKEIIGKLVDDDKIKAPTIRTTAEEFSSTDALSLTSDYSTTSSAPLTVPVTVTCLDSLAATSSDYASSDVSPCTYNTNSVSPGTTENMIEISELQSSPRLIGKEFRPSKMPAIFGANSTILTTGSIKLNARLHGNARNERRHSQIEPTKESKSLLIFSLAEEDSSSSSSRSSGQETHKGLKAIKLRSRGSIKRDSWRRHTLSDVDIIRQAIAQDAARESAQKNANHEERSSKVSKLARWIKQNLRRSSMDVQKNTTDKGSAVSTAPTLTQSSVSSETRTPLSEVFPSSGDEQL